MCYLTLISVTITLASIRHRLPYGCEFHPYGGISGASWHKAAGPPVLVLAGPVGTVCVYDLLCKGYYGSVFLVECFMHLQRSYFLYLLVWYDLSRCSCTRSCSCSCSSSFCVCSCKRCGGSGCSCSCSIVVLVVSVGSGGCSSNCSCSSCSSCSSSSSSSSSS